MNRKYSIDLLRIISAMAVIIIHVVTAPMANSAGDLNPALVSNLTLIHALMKWAVPVFFIITGYCLMLKKECGDTCCLSHGGKYIAALFTVGLFYALLELVFSTGTIGLRTIVQAIGNVIRGNLWDHMWYVYSIIGVYLVMPVIHSFMQRSARDAWTLTGLLFVFTVLFPWLERWIHIGFGLPFGGYLFYVCFGCAISRYPLKKSLQTLTSIAALAGAAWIFLAKDRGAFDYLSPAVCLMALGIFPLIANLDVKPSDWLPKLAACAWSVYLIHPLFINVVIKVLKIDLLSSLSYWKLGVFAAVITDISFAAGWMLRKIPVIKKLF